MSKERDEITRIVSDILAKEFSEVLSKAVRVDPTETMARQWCLKQNAEYISHRYDGKEHGLHISARLPGTIKTLEIKSTVVV